MEQQSDGCTHSDFIGDGKLSCTQPFMTSNFINENISKTRTNRTSERDQGTRWHVRNQSHFDRALDDT